MPRPDFFVELKRRKVHRAGVAYVAIAFGGSQAADLVLPALGPGSCAFNGLVIATLPGFPLALALAWMFDVGPGGVRRTGPVALDARPGLGCGPRRSRGRPGETRTSSMPALLSRSGTA